MAEEFLYAPGLQNRKIKMKLVTNLDGTHSPVINTEQSVHAILTGIAGAAFTSADQSGAKAAVTDVPATGKYLNLTGLFASAAAAMLVTFYEETSNVIVARFSLAAGGAFQWTPGSPIKLGTATGKRLMVQTSASGVLTVVAQYYTEV